MKAPKKYREGVTLIELLVAVAIFVILVGVTAPMMASYLPNQRLESAGRGLFAAVQQAKIEAVKNNKRCVVLFNPQPYTPAGQAGSYRIFLDENPGAGPGNDWAWNDGVDTPLGSVKTMPGNVSMYEAVFTDNGSNTTAIGFTSHGISDRAGGMFVTGYVRLRSSKNRYITVSVSPAGHIKLLRSSDGLNWN